VRGSLLAYTAAPHEVTRVRNLARCDLVLGILADSRALRLTARRELPHDWILAATTPYLVFSRLPRSSFSFGVGAPKA
jgi:hypothetical protein